METFLIPHSLQITMDDLGWFCGTDDRKAFGPARSGMPRRHCARDYEAVNELGRRLNMKINCAFVLGEWDPDNRLRAIPNLSKYGENWDNAAYFDPEEAAKSVAVLNDSPYIDIAIHGLLHNNYEPGSQYGNTDYFYKKEDTYYPVSEAQVRQRLDAWFDLVKYHGINQKINSFIAPNFVYRWDFLCHILKDYGVTYVSTVFDRIENSEGMFGGHIDHGMITLDRNFNDIPWYEVGSDPGKFPPHKGIFGCHWPNVLQMDPEGYPTVLDRWEAYFKQCAETFGIILSRDMEFCAAQTLHKRFAKVKTEGGKFVVDLTEVPKAKGLRNSFCISTRSPIGAYTGCEVQLLETHNGFWNYQIDPTDTRLTFQ